MVSNSVFKTFYETSNNALVFTDKEGKIISANQAAFDLFGYSKNELISLERKSYLDINDPEYLNLLQERAVNKGRIVGVLKGIKKDGTYFPIQVSSIIIQNDDGEEVLGTMIFDMSDQKNQENTLIQLLEETKKLHQHEEDSRILLDNVLDSITDGFFIVDKEWNILFWNKTAEKVLGKSEKELIGKNLWVEFPEFISLQEHINYEAVVGKNTSIRFREFFPLYNVWADVSVYPTEKNFSVYFKDVTEISNLRSLEKLERDVLEMNARPENSIEDTLKFYLQELEKLHEGMICSVLRLVGNKLYNWSSPSLSKEYIQAVEGGDIGPNKGSCGTAAFLKEKVVATDIDNDSRWVNFRELSQREGVKACWSFPIIDVHNQVLGTFAIYYRVVKAPTPEEENTLERAKSLLTIILENRISLETIRSSNQKYDMVSLATNDLIWDWHIETDEVIRTGQGLKTLFGYDDEDAKGDTNFWNSRIHPDDIKRVLVKQDAVINNADTVYWEDEYRFLKKDGRYAYVFDKGYVIRDKEGNGIRLIGATRDITERKETEALLLELNTRLKQRADELASSNIELERFAYIASHDMQEPLRMITSFLQLFKKKYENQLDETAEQYIHFAVDGAERMKKLIMDLLEYSRVGSNKDNLTDIDTNSLLQEVKNVFYNRIEELKAVINIMPLPPINGNKTQLFQLFQNLLGNALKYNNAAIPEVEISGKEEKDHFVFSVRDNGIGIKPVFFEKIFVLFQRLHHKNEYSGTGIGLAICKKIVDRHGGKIWVESEPGKGSCFYFTISKNPEEFR